MMEVTDVMDVLGDGEDEKRKHVLPRSAEEIEALLKQKRAARPAADVVAEQKARAAAKPTGLKRELLDLVGDRVPLVPQSGYKPEQIASVKQEKATPWVWAPFTNPARKDGLTLHHWCRASETDAPYVFAKFNQPNTGVPKFTRAQYNATLVDDAWTYSETQKLFELCETFSRNFIIVQDRYVQFVVDSKLPYPYRSVEDLKDRFYLCRAKLAEAAGLPSTASERAYRYDRVHEMKRKEQLRALRSRTYFQHQEELGLVQRLRQVQLEIKDKGLNKKGGTKKSKRTAAAAAAAAAATVAATTVSSSTSSTVAVAVAATASPPPPKKSAANHTPDKAKERTKSLSRDRTSSTSGSHGRPTAILRSTQLKRGLPSGKPKITEFVRARCDEFELSTPLATQRVLPEFLQLRSQLVELAMKTEANQQLEYKQLRLKEKRDDLLRSRGLASKQEPSQHQGRSGSLTLTKAALAARASTKS
eukprot:m.244847 g.244847  ORF g.244847 m.244847 type:complete len:475 (-) comp15356_c0_seq36:2363-3787(-)